MGKFFKEFKNFIYKGNLLDLAVAVIIGTAFNKIVTSLANDVIMPCISLLTGLEDFTSLSVVLRAETETNAAVILRYGSFLQFLYDFFIIAITVFIALKVVKKIKKSMDLNANMCSIVQKKLDNDIELSEFEMKWLKKYSKHYPKEAPKKKTEEDIKEEEDMDSTDKLLTEILNELKKVNNERDNIQE